LILYNGPTSPFGRTARVVSLELGIALEERIIDVYAATFLDDLNPLRQIPTLALDDGRAIYDSRVICAYFDSISGRPTLYPRDQLWAVETRSALAIGAMEAGLLRRMEMTRPAGEQSPSVIAKLEARIDRATDRLERLAPEIAAGSLRIDQIVVACALEYADLRYTRDWRRRCPALAAWLAGFADRPAMVATRPK
jgi:glutathione S-transferase